MGDPASPPRRSHRTSGPWQRAYAVPALGALLAVALTGCVSASGAAPTTVTSATRATAAADVTSSTVRASSAATSAKSSIPSLATGSGTLSVVALGDSVPSGAGCSCDPFPEQTAPLLQERTGRAVTVDNLAVGGQTSTDVLDQLADPDVLRRIQRADVVLVEIGANDFDESLTQAPECADPFTAACDGPALASTTTVLEKITATIAAQPRPADARIVLMGYWNVFRDGAVGAARGSTYVTVSAALTDGFNDVVEQVADAHGVTYADALTPFKGDGSKDASFALAPDGNHPNELGHKLLAEAVVDSLDRAGALD